MNVLGAIGREDVRLARQLSRLGWQSVRYALVSAFALACDVVTYTLALEFAKPPAIAGALGYATGLLLHYALSSGWVFPDHTGERRALPTFMKFAASGLIGLTMTTVVIAVLTTSGLSGPFGAKAAAVGLSYIAVFLVRRTYVFTPPRLERTTTPQVRSPV
jgi:putative flippase GtrA